MGAEDPNSPLYGRYYYSVHLERFDRKASVKFLRRGFEETNTPIEESLIEGVDAFDGVVGWLTFFGNNVLRGNHSLNEMGNAAISTVESEVLKLCSTRIMRYLHALKCLSQGSSSWSELKRCIERREGGTLSTSVLDTVIKDLEKMGIISKYGFLDPVYRKAATTF